MHLYKQCLDKFYPKNDPKILEKNSHYHSFHHLRIKSLISLPKLSLKYTKATPFLLATENLQPCSFLLPKAKLWGSTATPPYQICFLKSHFSPDMLHRMIPEQYKQREDREHITTVKGKEKRWTDLRGRSKGVRIRKGYKPVSSNSFPFSSSSTFSMFLQSQITPIPTFKFPYSYCEDFLESLLLTLGSATVKN